MFHVVLNNKLIIEDCSENIVEFIGVNKFDIVNNHISSLEFLKPCADMIERDLSGGTFEQLDFLGELRKNSILINITDVFGEDGVYQCFYDVYFDYYGDYGKIIVCFFRIAKSMGDYYHRNPVDVFRLLFDTIQTGLVIADLDGKYVKFNDAFSDMLGYSKEELLGKTYRDITHPDDIESDDKNVQKLLDGEIDYFKLSKKYISKSGSVIYVVIVVNLIRKPNGEPEFFISSVQDETKMVEYSHYVEKELIKTEDISRSKSVFIRNISHELRTPLNVMVNTANLLEGSSLDKEQRVLVRVFKDSSLVLLNLINDILDLSTMESNKFNISELPMDLKQLVAEVADMFIFESRSKGIRLHVDTSGMLVSNIVGDFLRIKQILVNMVGNAFKFTEKGSVSIICKSGVDSEGFCNINLSVLDTGIGLVESEKERIFDAFYQVSGISDKNNGIGVGLSIVKNLVDLMNGDIAVISKLGEGTCFTVTLKLRPVKEEIHVEKSIDVKRNQSDAVGVGNAIKILLVEDNDINRFVLVEVFKKLKCEVVALEDGSHVSQLIDLDKFDLVFMDIYMPIVDGFKASEKIRSMHSRNVPIIGMTASGAKDDYEKAMSSGMDEMLVKPVDIDDVRRILKLYAHRRAVLGARKRNLNIYQYLDSESINEDIRVQMYNLIVSNIQELVRKIYENIGKVDILSGLLHEFLGVCKVVGDFETERIINKWSRDLDILFELGHRQMFFEITKSVRSFLGRSDWMVYEV